LEEIATLCDDVSLAVADAIKGLIGTPKGDQIIGIGADGTPSRLIDIAAEDTALEILSSSGIDMKIVSEEKGVLIFGDKPEFTVVLDPLDGTYNATHNIPFYCISIAIGDSELSDIRYAKVFNLVNRTDFTAVLGGGAYYNNNKEIQVSSTSRIEECSVAGYGYNNGEEVFKRLSRHVRRIRTLGSAALELCYVASGKFDAFIDLRNRLRTTDVAAGVLIINEAQGVVTDGYNQSLNVELDVISKVNLVASNRMIHTILEKTIGL
jgi:myo-inositol-1(or 4)-monophosphatase